MERRNFLKNTGIASISAAGLLTASCNNSGEALLASNQIQHGVIFCLKYEKNSVDAKNFLEDGRRILSAIPVVQNFQVFKQVSPKNEFDYGFTMVFESMEDYQTYNNHPDHVDFVENRWKKEVTEFLEIDFEV